MKPDEFNEWIKRQVEENPEEAPEAAWEQISENLELETAWQGINQDLELDNLWTSIDNRLLAHEQMRRWDVAGTTMAVILAFFAIIPALWLQPYAHEEVLSQDEVQQTEIQDQPGLAQRKEQRFGRSLKLQQDHLYSEQSIEAAAEGQVQAQALPSSDAQLSKQGKGRRNSSSSESTSAPGTPTFASGDDLTPSVNSEVPTAKIRRTAKGNSPLSSSLAINDRSPLGDRTAMSFGALSAKDTYGLPANHPVNGLKASLSLKEGQVSLPALQAATVVPQPKNDHQPGHWRVGVGASARMSWLMNQKTYQAMEKSSLTTALPAYRKSVSLQLEKTISPKLALLTELAIHSETGQRYMEYQQGVYGETNTELHYHQLNFMAAYNARGLMHSRRPHARLLAGLSGGLLRRASMEAPFSVIEVTDEYRKLNSSLILGYEYSFPLMQRLRVNYGLRGHVDIFNIYAGSSEIPAELRHTRNLYLDFTVGFKYDIRKK